MVVPRRPAFNVTETTFATGSDVANLSIAAGAVIRRHVRFFQVETLAA